MPAMHRLSRRVTAPTRHRFTQLHAPSHHLNKVPPVSAARKHRHICRTAASSDEAAQTSEAEKSQMVNNELVLLLFQLVGSVGACLVCARCVFGVLGLPQCHSHASRMH